MWLHRLLFWSALLLGECAVGQGLVDYRIEPTEKIAKLGERYIQGMISLNSAQLTGFRGHLRDSIKRNALNKEADPIPFGCRLLERYLEKIYPNFFIPGRGVSLLLINLSTNRAYVKFESDVSGSLQEVEWTPAEVQAVALLVDALLRGVDEVRRLAQITDQGPAQLAKSWGDFSKLSSAPYIASSELAKYLSTVRTLAATSPGGIEGVRSIDGRAYSEIKTFLDNATVLESALSKRINDPAKAEDKAAFGIFILNPNSKVSEASSTSLFRQAISAKSLDKLTEVEADQIVRREIIPAYSDALKATAGGSWASRDGTVQLPKILDPS